MCPHMLYVVCCKRATKSILIAKTVRVAWEVVKRDQVTVAAWPAPYICTYGYICGVDILYLWTCHRKTRELLRSSCCPLLLVWPHKNLATLHICPQLFLPSQHCIFVQSNETFHSSFFVVVVFLCGAAWSRSCLLDSLEMHYGNFVAFSLTAPLLLIAHMSLALCVCLSFNLFAINTRA